MTGDVGVFRAEIVSCVPKDRSGRNSLGRELILASAWLTMRMATHAPTRRSARHQRKRHKRSWVRWGAGGLIIVAVIAFGAWVGARGLLAKSELESAQTLLSQMKTEAAASDMKAATKTVEMIRDHTRKAVSLTSDPIWGFAQNIPFIGVNFSVMRELALSVDEVVDRVVTPLIGVASGLDPASLAPKDGAIDIAPFVAIVPVVAEVTMDVHDLKDEIDGIKVDGALEIIVAARDKVSRLIDQVTPLLDTANSVVPLLPAALGAEGPRTYVVMFQNPAEARALGGTALSFAIVKVDNGKIDLAGTVPAAFGNFTKYEETVAPLPDGTRELYGSGLGTFIANVTLRPSFVTAAEMTQAMWLNDQGIVPDAIISVDPVMLSYLLQATGPIALSTGDSLTSKDLVAFLLNGVYQRYNTIDPVKDNRNQDVLYGEIVNATFAKLMSGSLNPKALVGALLQGWNEHRLLFWSSHTDEQALLTQNGLERSLPLSNAATDRVGVYVQDNVGSKLNFYLKEGVRLSQGFCRTDGLQSYRVSVDLSSALPPELVPSLSGSILGQYEKEGVAAGTQRLIVRLYSPPGTTITGASVNGAPAVVSPQHDTDYPVASVLIELAPAASGTITYDVVAAPGNRTLEAEVTPGVTTTKVTKEPLDCATVAAG